MATKTTDTTGQNDDDKTKDKPKLCDFFTENGYCTLGKKCKLKHDRWRYKEGQDGLNDEEIKDDDGNVLTEICFSFDTTGSMYSWLAEVRKSIRELVTELFEKIENIRISLIAHGDYCDGRYEESYIIKHVDFTTDQTKLVKFTNVKSTYGGGDGGECYELVMWTARNKLSWTKHSATNKVLVIIGDDQPHTPDFRDNKDHLDWQEEMKQLKKMGVHIYGVYCGRGRQYWNTSGIMQFYRTISQVTG